MRVQYERPRYFLYWREYMYLRSEYKQFSWTHGQYEYVIYEYHTQYTVYTGIAIQKVLVLRTQ